MPWKDTGYRVPVQTMDGLQEEVRAEEFIPDGESFMGDAMTGIPPTLLAQASRLWESYQGREYVDFVEPLPGDPGDTPLSWGVAVFEDSELVAIGYVPLHRNSHTGCGLRYEKSGQGKPPTFLFSRDEFATSPRSWEAADEEAILDMHQVWESFADPTAIRFRSRLALSGAHIFGFIPELPEGYHEADEASRQPMPGRLTEAKLQHLIAEGKIQAGDTIFIEGDESYQDSAPDRKAVVKELPEGPPCIIAGFPQHRMRNGRSWWHTMFPRYLCYRDGQLYHAKIAENEWQPHQYDEAEKRGESW